MKEKCFSRLGAAVSRGWGRFAMLFALTFSAAAAHDATELTAKARLYADRIEVEVTCAYVTANRLLAIDQAGPPSAEKFAAIKPSLVAGAPRWIALVSQGRPLASRKIAVELTRDDEVRLQWEFPSAASDSVRLDGALLRTLGSEAYHCLLTVYGREPTDIRYEVLRLGKPSCELQFDGKNGRPVRVLAEKVEIVP